MSEQIIYEGTECCNASEEWSDCVIIDPAYGLPHAECYAATCTGCDKVTWLDCEIQ
jgi:hypothetical protein